MAKYYIRLSEDLNGCHPVHKCGCPFIPDEGNRIPLGNKSDWRHAMAEAKKYYSNVNGCYFCNKESYDSKFKKMNDMILCFLMSLN
jgi:hypothetical protein